MPEVTTQSGQAARSDLIAMFEQAQQVAGAERRRARGFQMVIKRAVSTTSEVRERGDEVEVQMPRESWQALQDCAADQP
jgi:hypothetical protein